MAMLPGLNYLNYCLKSVRIDMREQGESTPIESDSTMTESDMTAQEWKEKGNEEYKKGNWAKALNHYTNALRLVENNAEEAVYYKNRAAVYLMLHDYDEAVKDCDMALMIHRNDPKALYRRCQALMELERFEEAYRDAEIIISSYPNNKIVQPAAARLLEILQKRLNENAEIRAKVYTMLNLAFNMSAEKEKRETAMNNLLVLAREKVGAEEIFEEENLFKITHVVKLQKNEKMICSAIRIVGELCKNNISQTESIMRYVGLPWCLEMMNSTSSERVNASQYCLQNILNTYSGMNNEPDSKPDEALCEEHKKEIDTILSCLLNSVTSKTITGLARDAIIQFITRNIHYATLDWAKRLVEFDGLKKLMKVASQLEEYKYKESSINITSSTRSLISVCLAKIYEKMYYDDDKRTFINAVNDFIGDNIYLSYTLLSTELTVRAVVAITTLIFGPLDVADAIIYKKGRFEIILAMAETDHVLQQKVACECIFAAATKYNYLNVFLEKSIEILENLYRSKNDSIRVQAFVSLCKLSRFEESSLRDIAIFNSFSYEMSKELAKISRRFLINPEKEDMRKWAIISLSYLTTHAAIKEKLIEDEEAIEAIIELAKTDDQSVLWAVVTTLVNLCNAYDNQELIPEMNELLKFGRHHHIFGRNEKLNTDKFVNERRCALAKAGVTSALASLAKTNNQNCKELIARVFNTICIPEEVREVVVEEGGTEALLSLAHVDGTDKGKKYASRALVHLALTIDPEVAFPGQLIMEVVRPIVNLLDPECSVNETCETLTALCNLASVNDSMRKHVFNEADFEKFANYVKSNNYMLKLKSALLFENLTLCREIATQCRELDSRIMYLVFDTLWNNESTKMKIMRQLIPEV